MLQNMSFYRAARFRAMACATRDRAGGSVYRAIARKRADLLRALERDVLRGKCATAPSRGGDTEGTFRGFPAIGRGFVEGLAPTRVASQGAEGLRPPPC